MTNDLVIVVADGGIEQALRDLLSRHERLQIRPLVGVEFPKLRQLDAGTYQLGPELAKPYRNTFAHALVVLDTAWEGAPPAADIVAKVETDLAGTWADAGRCVAIDPELEVWLWSDSPQAAAALGWPDMATLRTWMAARDYWPAHLPKPPDPRAAYLAAIREKRRQNSNATFRIVAEQVSFRRCSDPAFNSLKTILQRWFPPVPSAR